MNTLGLPTPDLFIGGTGRSGSTMLANLFTQPPDHWLLVEPRFANGSTGADLLAQAASMGIDVDSAAWPLRLEETAFQRNSRCWSEVLSGLTRWGLKEVRPDLLVKTHELMAPRNTIVLVRDLRDVAASLLEKMRHDANAAYDDNWLRQYLTDSPQAVLDLLSCVQGLSYRIVRYEDLVSEPQVRAGLASWLDWPLVGRPDRNLASIYNRDREVKLHGGIITEHSVGRRDHVADDEMQELLSWVHLEQAEYQQRFGYMM